MKRIITLLECPKCERLRCKCPRGAHAAEEQISSSESKDISLTKDKLSFNTQVASNMNTTAQHDIKPYEFIKLTSSPTDDLSLSLAPVDLVSPQALFDALGCEDEKGAKRELISNVIRYKP